MQYHGSFSNYVKSKFKIQSFLNKDGYFHISNADKRKYSSLINTKNKNINTISNLKFKNKIFGLDINLLNENFTKKILSFSKLNYDHNKKLNYHKR